MNRANTRVRAALVWAAFSAALMVSSAALAQSASGRIQGKVLDAVSAKPLTDVVITATSPALQGEQTVVTDTAGEFEIPVLPPGTYLLHLEKEGYKPLNQPDITVRLDKTVRVNLPLVPESVKAEEIVIVGKAPTVDVGSTQTGATITNDFIEQVPVASPHSFGGDVRSFESLQSAAPGTAEDTFGISVAGTTSPENSYVIDGVQVNDASLGLLGSPLSIDFIKEVDVISGGYMPEYGHAQGGVTQVLTKSGGNEFHGSLGLYVTPGFLQAPAKNVIPQGDSISVRAQNTLNANLAMEVGGPIVKDKLWFYVGLEPTYTKREYDRYVNLVDYQKGCPVDAAGNAVGSSADPAFDHYSADITSCPASSRGVATDAAGSPQVASTTPVKDSERKYYNTTFQYQYIAKLTYLLNQDQHFTASVFGNPAESQGAGGGTVQLPVNGTGAGPASAFASLETANVNDYSLRWDGSFFDKHMLSEAVLGWHHQFIDTRPEDPALESVPEYIYGYSPSNGLQHSLVEFEPDSAQWCGADDPTKQFQTCPLPGGYVQGWTGLIQTLKIDTYQGRLALTNLFQAAGHHEVKYGVDYMYERFDELTEYPGGVEYYELAPQIWIDARRFGYLSAPDQPVFLPSFNNVTKSVGVAGFAQDSYRVLDLVTLNAGVRWEDQQLIGGTGQTVVSLPNNWQPRVGLIYDFTHQGRSKLFANYAVFYEQVPLDAMDREFPPSTTIYGIHQCDPKNHPDPSDPKGGCGPQSVLGGGTTSVNNTWTANGGTSTPVDPNLKGESSTEISAGGEYEVIPDGRLGVTYVHRSMNNVIEDGSRDNGNTYALGNAGSGIFSDFPAWTRDYNAGTIYFDKSFSHRWQIAASYTLSRLAGNYQGLFIDQPGFFSQLDPNINASGDLKQWFANASGPLPGDHTHNVKIFGSYQLPINGVSDMTIGLTYQGLSGSPSDYLGYDTISYNIYGQPNIYILPRGSGPRLPWTHEVDSAFRYNHKVGDNTLTVSAEIFNLLDLREVTGTNQVYSNSVLTAPVLNGTPDQLANLKDVNGNLVIKNPTFGQPTSYQPPLSVRLGLKLTF